MHGVLREVLETAPEELQIGTHEDGRIRERTRASLPSGARAPLRAVAELRREGLPRERHATRT